MNEIVIVVLAVFFLLLFFWFKKPKEKTIKGDELAIWPFESMPIMTDSEVQFFKKLQLALPEYIIFSQVQLSRIIQPGEEAGSDHQFWLNRVCRQSVDFVLIDKNMQTVLVAIELDDWTHESHARQKQDAKKDKALASAGIPIIRFHAEKMPNIEMLRFDVLDVLRKFG